MENKITPDQVKCLDNFTNEFLCEVKENIYKFKAFKVRDMDPTILSTKFLTNQTIKTKDDPTSESSRVIKYYL
jgi:hypothetical protein